MGYSTDFVGAFKFSKTLTREQREYLLKFSDTRRSIVVTDNVIDVRKGEKVRMTHNRHFKNETCLGWSVPAKPARA